LARCLLRSSSFLASVFQPPLDEEYLFDDFVDLEDLSSFPAGFEKV